MLQIGKLEAYPTWQAGVLRFELSDRARHRGENLLRAIGRGMGIQPTATADGYNAVQQLFKQSDLSDVSVDWESMTPAHVRWKRSKAGSDEITTDDLPTRQDWFDAYVHIHASDLLSQ